MTRSQLEEIVKIRRDVVVERSDGVLATIFPLIHLSVKVFYKFGG